MIFLIWFDIWTVKLLKKTDLIELFQIKIDATQINRSVAVTRSRIVK